MEQGTPNTTDKNRDLDPNKFFIHVKLPSSEMASKRNRNPYPCMCQAASSVLFWGRLYGLLPVVRVGDRNQIHPNGCPLKVSHKWLTYSITVEVIYFAYFCFGYGQRLIRGTMVDDKNTSEWYVMTIGYMVSDFDSLVTILLGMILAKKVCRLFEKISQLPGSVCEMRTLQNHHNSLLTYSMTLYLIVLASYIYVAYLRITYDKTDNYANYDILDSWFACLVRGLTVFIPMVQLMIVFMFGCIIWLKFENLAITAEKSIRKLSELYSSASYQQSSRPNTAEDVTFKICMLPHLSVMDVTEELEQLSRTHQEISDVLAEVNECVGIQILVGVSASLYTLIYYLYRYSTAAENGFSSNENERVHYMIGLFYRMSKMLIYMLIGKFIHVKSLQPLRVIQSSKLVNLPIQVQQQVQTLLLQWSGKSGYLSAFGVINIGPWLLAPIVGNVITYLLVALQFESTIPNIAVNVTKGMNGGNLILL